MNVCLKNKYSRLDSGILQKQTFPKPVFEVEGVWQLMTRYNLGNHLLYSYINSMRK